MKFNKRTSKEKIVTILLINWLCVLKQFNIIFLGLIMKKIFFLLATAGLLAGCAGGKSPVGLALISHVKGPITATDHVSGTKTGSSCASNVLGIVASGDASIATAKNKAGITKVATVDYKTSGFFPIYGKTCVNVTGE